MTEEQDANKIILPLFRRGQWYESLDCVSVHKTNQTHLSLAPRIMMRDDARWFKKTSGSLFMPIKQERIRILSDAIRIFSNETVEYNGETQGVADFIDRLWEYNGLPDKLTRDWLRIFGEVFESQEWDCITEGQKGEIALVSLPSNTFLCLEACFNILVSGKALWIRPSQREPFSCIRFIASLVQSGWPKEALGFYGTSRSDLSLLVSISDKAILFGGEQLEKEYKDHKNVELKGPGRTCAIIGRNMDRCFSIEWLMEKVAGNAGRFCTCASTILCLDDFEAISGGLANQLDCIPIDSGREDTPFPLTQLWEKEEICQMESWVRSCLQPNDVILTSRPFVIETNEGKAIPAPTLIALGNPLNHPLLGMELPFPFAAIAQVREEDIQELTRNANFIFRIGEGQ